jgi:hypothetical protein
MPTRDELWPAIDYVGGRESLDALNAHGHAPAIFESQLALGQFQASAGMPAAASSLAGLEREATQKGFLRIARLAREVRGKTAMPPGSKTYRR